MKEENKRGVKFKIISPTKFFEALGLEENTTPYKLIAEAAQEFEPEPPRNETARVVISDKTIKHHLETKELSHKSLASIICYIFRYNDNKDQILDKISTLLKSIEKSSGHQSQREINAILAENILLKVNHINDVLKFPSDFQIKINRDWEVGEKYFKINKERKSSNNTRLVENKQEQEDSLLDKFGWASIILVLSTLLPLLSIPIILIGIYRVNIHFNNPKNKLFKNLVLIILLLVNIGFSYVLWENLEMHSGKEINEIINDTVQKTKKLFRRSQFHKDPNDSGDGFLYFGTHKFSNNEFDVRFLKAGESKEILVTCKVVNGGSFTIYNASAILSYENKGNSNSTRLISSLNGNCANESDSAYIINLPSSWSLETICARVENNQESKCDYCLGYNFLYDASVKQIEITGIPLGDMDVIKGNKNGKKCSCDVSNITYHLLLTNLSNDNI